MGLAVANNALLGAQIFDKYAEGGGKNINNVDEASFTLGTTGVMTTGFSWRDMQAR